MMDEKLIEKLTRDRDVRLAVIEKSHEWFFSLYLPHYVRYETGPFQRDIFRMTEDDSLPLACVMAFRGSAKSTIVTTSFPLWSILGRPQRKFVLVLSQTKEKAQLFLQSVRSELETNDLLKADLGPFREEPGPWGNDSLFIPHFGARIAVGSVGQSLRGVRHNAHRPDLIVLDDIEDIQSVRTREGREKAWSWLTGEVIPAGDLGTRVFAVGNLLHDDATMPRLCRAIESGRVPGRVGRYPIVGKDGRSLWPGKYPDSDAVETERAKLMDERAWQREYMLNIVADEDQVVHPQWIRRYDGNPFELVREASSHYPIVGVDLAISTRDSADCTAMVSALVCGQGEGLKVYILPEPVNERLEFPETKARLCGLVDGLGQKSRTLIVVEDVAYQAALPQQLVKEGYRAEGYKIGGQDKRTRLALTTAHIKSGKILFPRTGTERLIEQLTGFGTERHDDLADAFSVLVGKVIDLDRGNMRQGMAFIDGSGQAVIVTPELMETAGAFQPMLRKHQLEQADMWNKVLFPPLMDSGPKRPTD
ncbi:hypothetical protein ACFL26_01050 [Patescibacteria group bacterium]